MRFGIKRRDSFGESLARITRDGVRPSHSRGERCLLAVHTGKARLIAVGRAGSRWAAWGARPEPEVKVL